jgi:hypothetical protein
VCGKSARTVGTGVTETRARKGTASEIYQ